MRMAFRRLLKTRTTGQDWHRQQALESGMQYRSNYLTEETGFANAMFSGLVVAPPDFGG